MKNPVIATVVIVAALAVLIIGGLQFAIGPSSARNKEAELNRKLDSFRQSQGTIASTATTGEVMDAVFAGKSCTDISVPVDYHAPTLSLSPVYEAKYNPDSASFKVSFSIVRFLTHKPYISTAAVDSVPPGSEVAQGK
jgi:hypothetical protein